MILHLQTPRGWGVGRVSCGGFRAGSWWDDHRIEDRVAGQTCCFVGIRDGFLLLQPPLQPPKTEPGYNEGPLSSGPWAKGPVCPELPPGSWLGSWRGDGRAVWSVLNWRDPVALLADSGHLRAGTRHVLSRCLGSHSPSSRSPGPIVVTRGVQTSQL